MRARTSSVFFCRSSPISNSMVVVETPWDTVELMSLTLEIPARASSTILWNSQTYRSIDERVNSLMAPVSIPAWPYSAAA